LTLVGVDLALALPVHRSAIGIIMADHAAEEDIFVYTGGRAPFDVVNAIIDESVDKIDDEAFRNNLYVESVVCHDRLLKVGTRAFQNCISLQRVKMPGVKIIEGYAFHGCSILTHVEFDTLLETVGDLAFASCHSLKRVKFPKVKNIGRCSFISTGVEELEFGEDLETIGSSAFWGSKLRRIAIPLKDEMFQFHDDIGAYTQFHSCPNLTTVDLVGVGGIHKTVASLHLESWRNEMNEEIQRINQVLPGTDLDEKTDVIRQWIRSVISKIDHYKAEHSALLREATTRLELALWDVKLTGFKVEDDIMGPGEKHSAKKAKIDYDEGARKQARITSGADIIIKNVLPYLKME
jgi:hypothetical protein